MKLDIDKINLNPKTLEEATDVIGQLVKIIIELKKENDSLREQLNMNSKNSSLPPSQDKRKKKIPKAGSGRKPGGQPGHKGWQRIVVPPSQVSDTIDCKPGERCDCGGQIKLKDKVQIHQVFEIPVANYEVIEYRLYKGDCDHCHARYEGKLPAGVSRKGFGTRAQAMISLLTSKYRLSKRLVQSRGKKVAKELMGNHHGRVIVTDRYPAYDYLPSTNHQVCWAHLKRDFQKISERRGESSRIGIRLLHTYEQLFGFWKTTYQEEPTLSKRQRKRLRYLKNKWVRGLQAGIHCSHAKTARTCKNRLELEQSLWRFFDVKGVPPTNNQAERQLRPLVISKKLTFGTQSDRGSRFIERILTAVMTCQQQGRDVLGFMMDAIHTYVAGETAPSLRVASARIFV